MSEFYQGVTVSSQSASAPIYVDSNAIRSSYRQSANVVTSLGLICTVSNGASLTYSVQVTCDPPTSPIVNWNNHDVLVAQTGSANSNILYPVTAVRLNVTAWSSGSVNLGMARWP